MKSMHSYVGHHQSVIHGIPLSCRYSFGDCRYPSSESAALIEEITHQQIKELVRDTGKSG